MAESSAEVVVTAPMPGPDSDSEIEDIEFYQQCWVDCKESFEEEIKGCFVEFCKRNRSESGRIKKVARTSVVQDASLGVEATNEKENKNESLGVDATNEKEKKNESLGAEATNEKEKRTRAQM